MQIILAGLVLLSITHGGGGATVTVVEHELVQPFASVTVTVYTVVTLGVTVVIGVVAPVLHKKDTPPAAVSMCESPGQIVAGGQITHIGPEVTTTVAEHELLHPLALVIVTK